MDNQSAAPAEPVAPVAPAEPAAPVAPDAAQAADDQEWEQAANNLFPGLNRNKQEKTNEPTDPNQAAKTPEAAKSGQAGAEPPKPGDEGAAEAGDEAGEEDEGFDPTAYDSRVAQRQAAREMESVRSDVRKQLFAEVPTELRDADGDPIRTIDDVMKLINPNTGNPFTQEEAGMWLLAAQQQFNQNLAGVEKQIDQIAEVNVDLKDQADMVKYKYGELLKAIPELRDQVWAEYDKTLVRDPKTNIIIKAPVSLERFYDVTLKPYVELAKKMEADKAQKAEADRQAAEQAQRQRQQSRADRSDIYTGGKDLTDPEDKEWAEAATAVFGPRK